jgi:hypothetical protein
MTPKMKKWRESVRNGAKGAEMTRKGQGWCKRNRKSAKTYKEIAKKLYSIYRCN